MNKTLRFHIGLLVASLLSLAIVAVLLAVWVSTTEHARQQAENDLQVGRNVFEQVMATRETQLINMAQVLTADFGFREAVASGDAATINSALLNQGRRIDADLMAIMRVDGGVLSDTSNRLINTDHPYWKGLITQTLDQGGISVVVVLDGHIYQIFLLEVRAPITIAIAVVGFELDQTLASHLKKITHLDVTLVADSLREESPPIIVSTLPAEITSRVTESLSSDWRLPFSNKTALSTIAYPFSGSGESQVIAYLSIDLNQLFTEFDRLQIEITFIALLAIIVALIVGVIFAANLTRPLNRLALAAKAVAQGEYQYEMPHSQSTQEIIDLTLAFDVMQQGIRKRESRILYQATHDVVTGLINREELGRKIDIILSNKKPFYLVGLSLSNVRQINDMFGPSTADRCLRSVSLRFLRHVRLAARISGGGFVGVLDGPPDLQRVKTLCKQIKVAAESDGVNVNFEVHAGLVSWPTDVDGSEALLRRLDIATDSARYAVDGLHHYREGQEEDYVKRLQVIDDLRSAMKDHGRGLQMYYQPKMNLQIGSVTRMEALIRWVHPIHGFVPPDYFIPLAEQAGLINELTEWVVGEVIRQLQLWHAQGLPLQVAINLSAQDIARSDMLNVINALRAANDLPASSLAFEITESEVMKHPEQAIQLLKGFRASGFDLAIDDFGTGYSSLSQLKHMPVTELKIDRDFVMNLTANIDDQTIVKSTIELAHRFGLEVVAEGVEDAGSLQLLADWGCEWAQGYYLARPLPAEKIPEWLADFHADPIPSV